MKLRLLSLVLLGITLLDVTQARTIEKKEINEEDYTGKREVNEEEEINIESDNSVCSCNNGECNRCDDNGCEQVSNCNGKREASKIDYEGAAELLEMFKADNSNCKCLNHGYCLERKDSKSEYTEVNGCGERKCYTHCDSSGCREVCDGQCKCDYPNHYCEQCDDKGCKQVKYCQGNPDYYAGVVWANNCTECNNYGCVKAQPTGHHCNRLCDDHLDDIVLQDKCVCKKDDYGKEKCQMCDLYQCNPVTDCSKFATCTLDHRDNTYRRCYGYNHGESHCRTLYSAVEYKKRDEEWIREIEKKNKSCECPSNGGDCKMCIHNGLCRVGGFDDYKCSDSDVFNVTANRH